MQTVVNRSSAQDSARLVVQHYLDRVPPPVVVDAGEETRIRARVTSLLKKQDAVVVAHYYTPAVIQDIALETGGCVSDSLEMARFSRDHSASTLVVAGVRFMGETAKILAPSKRILMPALEATCSLDVGCPPEDFAEFCERHSERCVVVYANTSATVKACADWVVTSSNACEIVSHLDARSEKVLWAPDRYLGSYVQRLTGADMVMWEGSCIVHEEFKARGLRDLKAIYPDATVLAHPESPMPVLDMADHVGSTSQILHFAHELDSEEFIVATDEGLFHRLRQELPQKNFIIAPTAGHGATCRSCARCPWMAMNELQRLEQCLDDGSGEIVLDPQVLERARLPLARMLSFRPGH